MNSKLLHKPILKEKPQKKKNPHLQKLKMNADETRSTFFKVFVPKQKFNALINTLQEWSTDDTKPQLKDYLCRLTDNAEGYVIIFHTTAQQRLSSFGLNFGHDNCSVATECKGHKNLEKYEQSLDRNIHTYFRPKLRGEAYLGELEDLYQTFHPEELSHFEHYDPQEDDQQGTTEDQQNNPPHDDQEDNPQEVNPTSSFQKLKMVILSAWTRIKPIKGTTIL